MPVVVGSPFGSPVSLAPLTFNNAASNPLPGHVSVGVSAEPPEDTPAQHQPVASRWAGGPGTVAA
jgi:hypothetical protein